jgi:hypothetical protein
LRNPDALKSRLAGALASPMGKAMFPVDTGALEGRLEVMQAPVRERAG